ncbi:EF-hand domain-containing protein [Stenotrophomonas maltophilia]|uniref:EF-hand domain-containing protein n=1 Tax=Stenotrophomonas maltophilia TaxID=40324 RepID=UPI001E3914CE|nr:EF-hand domain-containing protein [Stenotrophomonas maltophilia]
METPRRPSGVTVIFAVVQPLNAATSNNGTNIFIGTPGIGGSEWAACSSQIGVGSGFPPARRAARLDPVTAKAEYAKCQQGRFSQQADSIDAAFSAMDRNKDGRISKEEANVVPEIAKYFAGLDTDGDGYLSLKEMQQAMVAAQTADAPTK